MNEPKPGVAASLADAVLRRCLYLPTVAGMADEQHARAELRSQYERIRVTIDGAEEVLNEIESNERNGQ